MPRSTVGAMGLVLALALCATGARAQHRPANSRERDDILDRMDERMAEIDALLLAGDAKRGYKQAEKLAQEMVDRFISHGEGYLARALVLRAVAAYRLGRPDEAVWHWQVAAQIAPVVQELELTAYGEAWELLTHHPPPAAGSVDEELGVMAVDPALGDRELTPPKVRHTPRPLYPPAKRGTRPRVVIIRTIVGKDGRVREPVLIEDAGEPTMAYAALEALRQWQFEPAMIDGEPVDVWYHLTVNFRSRGRD